MPNFEKQITSGPSMRRRVGRTVRVAGVAVLALLAACAKNAPMDFLEPEGPVAQRVDNLFNPIFWIAAAMFVLVEGLIIVAMVKFRHRPGVEPKQVHGSRAMELGWTIAPALLLAVIAVPTVLTIFALAQKPANNPLTIKVTGHQWWWRYDYAAEGVATANELHIPTNRPVLLELEAADVIHSYWIPKLVGKQDVVPGRTNHMSFEASKPGTYLGQCTEYCGLSHANMRIRVIAHTPEDFATWVSEQKEPAATPSDPIALRGKELFETLQCAGCHTIEGTKGLGKTGPDLTHLQSRTTFAGATFDMNSENLQRWLRDPPKMKPGSKMPKLGLSEEEINSLVAYLETLK